MRTVLTPHTGTARACASESWLAAAEWVRTFLGGGLRARPCPQSTAAPMAPATLACGLGHAPRAPSSVSVSPDLALSVNGVISRPGHAALLFRISGPRTENTQGALWEPRCEALAGPRD